MSELFCFGLGYSAEALARRLLPAGWRIAGTATTTAGVARIPGLGCQGLIFDGSEHSPEIAHALATATHVLVSAPPGRTGDPVLLHHAADLAAAPHLIWIGYLSTIGVYGDWQGAWVDEETPPRPVAERSKLRLAAESQWLALASRTKAEVQVFRLAGIYGPGRSAIDTVRDGTARSIVKKDQVFNRIHVEDIASVLEAAITRGGTHTVYNVTDDEPAPPQDVVRHAAQLLGLPPPPVLDFEAAELSPMARSFYSENKRVRNSRLKADLGVALRYPTYREGLAAISGKIR